MNVKRLALSAGLVLALAAPAAAQDMTVTGNLTVAGQLRSGVTDINLLGITSAATGLPVRLAPAGSSADTNVGIIVAPKGNLQACLGGTTLANASLCAPTTASAVNQWVATAAITSGLPTFVVGGAGADANSSGLVAANGTGTLYLGGTTAANATAAFPSTASSVNQVVVTSAATGSVPTIALGGSGADANRSINVAGAGTGIVTLGQTICTVTGTTPQTCNGQRGIVTTGTLTTAAATDATFTINNSSVASTSLVVCTDQGYSGTLVTNGYPIIMTCVPGSGSIAVHITNTHAANALNGTVQIGFAVLN